MENIKVSYTQNWDCEGYHTTPNIRLSTDLFTKFNAFLTECRKPIESKTLKSNSEMKLLMYGKILLI